MAIGSFVALVIWVVLFGQLVDLAPLRYPTFDAAKSVAVAESGKYRLPGNDVRVLEIDVQRLDVERRWLGISESVVRVEQTQAGWMWRRPTGAPGGPPRRFSPASFRVSP